MSIEDGRLIVSKKKVLEVCCEEFAQVSVPWYVISPSKFNEEWLLALEYEAVPLRHCPCCGAIMEFEEEKE